MTYQVTAQTRQTDGTIHASRTEVPVEELVKFLGIQRAEAGDNLISQEVHPA